MKLKHYFLILGIGVALIAGIALFATFRVGEDKSPSWLFYVTEGLVIALLIYLGYFYRKTIRPYDTLIGGMELVRDLDLTTRLVPSGQHETDIIVRTFNDLLNRLRSEHLRLEEQYTFLNLLIEASPMGVIQCDLNGKVTSMNPSAREMLSPGMEETLLAFNDLIRCAASYGELMTSTYSLLFDSGSARDRRLSTEELYEYAIQFIDDNYAQPLSMQSVCDEIGISQTYLSRLFRKYSDTTFNAYLTRCRMEAAKQLLREKPDLLLRDVAACVGYEDSSYFTTVFHQYTGLTPSQYATGDS